MADPSNSAQVSDIHYDEYAEPSFVREVVRRVNTLHPDVGVFTGDFVTAGAALRLS